MSHSLFKHEQCFIDLVPNDVLLEIFPTIIESSVGDFTQPMALEPWITILPSTISHVCRRWRDISLPYSPLWSHIYTASLEQAQVYLDRSGLMPLDIRLGSLSQGLVHLIEASQRQTVSITRVSADSTPSYYCTQLQIPHLKSFTLVNPPAPSNRSSIDPLFSPHNILCAQNLPPLTKLHLGRFLPPIQTGFT